MVTEYKKEEKKKMARRRMLLIPTGFPETQEKLAPWETLYLHHMGTYCQSE